MSASQADQIAMAQKAWEDRIQVLRESPCKIDNLTAVLMETCCGEQGWPESTAKIRANAIFGLILEWNRREQGL